MTDSNDLKLGTTICGTVILIVMLLTDGPVAATIAGACAAAAFGVGGFLGKRSK